MLDNLYVDSAGLPPKLAFSVRQHLREYVRSEESRAERERLTALGG